MNSYQNQSNQYRRFAVGLLLIVMMAVGITGIALTFTSSAGAAPSADCGPAWQSGATYNGGDVVSYNSENWQANWWTQAQPGSNGDWSSQGACTQGPTPTPEVCATPWRDNKEYPTAGTKVSHIGYNWTNNYYANAGDTPGSATGTWAQGVACIAPTPLPPPTNPDGAHIYYFPEWGVYGRNFQVGDIQPLVQEGYVDTIQYAFIEVVADGSCEIDDPFVGLDWTTGTNGYDQTGTLAQMAALRDDYIGNLKIVFSLGGWTLSDHFSPIAADPVKRANLVSSCVALMQQYDFDGLDIDWEFPGGGGRFDNNNAPNHETVDGPNFALLLQELRAGLDAAGTDSNGDPYLLTIAVNAGQDKIERLPIADIYPSVDYIQLMTYDLNGGWSNMPAHNAPLYANPNDPRVIDDTAYTKNYNSAYAVQAFLDGGVPASKLVLGLAFYGRSWVNVDASQGFDPDNQPGLFAYGNNGNLSEESGYWCSCEPDYDLVLEPIWNDDGGGLISNSNNQSPGPSADGLGGGSWDEAVYDYDDVQNILLTNGWTRYWDEASQSPYAYNPNYQGGSWVSYDDVQSIAAKTQFAADNCLGGIMVWEFTGNNENTDLYGAVQDGMGQSTLGLGSTDANCPNDVVTPTPEPTATPDPNATATPTPIPTATPDPNATDPVKIFYYPEWGVYGRDYYVDDIEQYVAADQVNLVQYAFIDVDPNGNCVLFDSWAANEKPGRGSYTQLGSLRQLAALRDNYSSQLKVVMSLGGWTLSENFTYVAADPTKLATMATSCVGLMQQYDFDGLDIDWEYPGAPGLTNDFDPTNDGPNYVTMLQTLRAALDTAESQDGREYLLTAATGVGEDKFKMFPMGTASQYVDYFSIMAYDMNGAWQERPAHNAPLFRNPDDQVPNNTALANYNVEYAVDMYLNGGIASDGTVVEGGVPQNKLVLGVPFYGRSWVNVPNTEVIAGLPGLFTTSDNGANVGTTEPDYENMPSPMWDPSTSPGTIVDSVGNTSGGSWEESVFDYDDMKLRLLNTGGYTRYWDEDSWVPYAYNPGVAGGTLVSYADEESVCYKAKYAAHLNLAGVMVWDMTQNSESGNDDLYAALDIGWAGGSSLCADDFGTVDPNGTLSGLATRQGASDHSGIVVAAWNGATEIGSTTTDAAGNYTLSLPAGTYTITVEGPLALDAEKANVVITASNTTTLSAVVLLAGDLDDNDTINIFDLTIVGAQYGNTSASAGWDSRADLTQNGTVDIYDLSIMGSNYGKSSPVDWQ